MLDPEFATQFFVLFQVCVIAIISLMKKEMAALLLFHFYFKVSFYCLFLEVACIGI